MQDEACGTLQLVLEQAGFTGLQKYVKVSKVDEVWCGGQFMRSDALSQHNTGKQSTITLKQGHHLSRGARAMPNIRYAIGQEPLHQAHYAFSCLLAEYADQHHCLEVYLSGSCQL